MGSSNPYFPLFMDLGKKKILCIGGGAIAERRINTLLAFDVNVTVISPKLSENLRKKADAGLFCWENRCYYRQCLRGMDIVLICTDDPALNHEIWEECRKTGRLVNNCSNRKECDFFFPAVVHCKDVVVAVNAGGKDHGKVRRVREKIEQNIEEYLDE